MNTKSGAGLTFLLRGFFSDKSSRVTGHAKKEKRRSKYLFLAAFLFYCAAAVASDSAELKDLKFQLELKKGLLAQVTQGIENLKAHPRYCARGQMTLVINNDPEGQLRQEISVLENQIRALEEKEWSEIQKKHQGTVYKTGKSANWWDKLLGKT